jgi:hypothetical protein
MSWVLRCLIACVSLRYAVQPKLTASVAEALEITIKEHLVGEPFSWLGHNGDEYRRYVLLHLLVSL